MALNRYVLTADVTVPAGTAAAMTAGEPGTGQAASHGSAATTGGPLWPVSYPRNTVLLLDPAGPLFAQIGAPNLRAFTDGTDTIGHQGLAD
jgi:hypothetical protein